MSNSAFFPGYSGPERRCRLAYVTQNTEYHTQDGICVAVRDRATGQWLLRHSALRRRVSAAIRFASQQLSQATDPVATGGARVGDALYFASDGPDVVTTNLLSIGRPERATVCAYPV